MFVGTIDTFAQMLLRRVSRFFHYCFFFGYTGRTMEIEKQNDDVTTIFLQFRDLISIVLPIALLHLLTFVGRF